MSAVVHEVDKSEWPDGPWRNEPDRVEFQHAGLPCLILRNPYLGFLCGYVAVPPGHPWHGKEYDDREVSVDVHGGLTYSAKCNAEICHKPAPGEPDNVWWFGFDCAHCYDLAPFRPPDIRCEVYRPLAYVREEVIKLAEQLAGIK